MKYIFVSIGLLIFIYLLFFSNVSAESLGGIFTTKILPIALGLAFGYYILKKFRKKKEGKSE